MSGARLLVLLALAFIGSPSWAQVPPGYTVIGQHNGAGYYPTLSCTPGAPLGFLRTSTQAWFDEADCPPSGSYTCALTYDPGTGADIGWAGGGTCYQGPSEPEPPSPSASGALTWQDARDLSWSIVGVWIAVGAVAWLASLVVRS